MKSSDRIAVMGLTVARELFGKVDVVGKVIRIKNIPFRIVGVLAEREVRLWQRSRQHDISPHYDSKIFNQKQVSRSVSYIILKVKDEIELEVAESRWNRFLESLISFGLMKKRF